MSALREQGIRHIAEVEEARLEGNGKFTVVGRDAHRSKQDDGPVL